MKILYKIKKRNIFNRVTPSFVAFYLLLAIGSIPLYNYNFFSGLFKNLMMGFMTVIVIAIVLIILPYIIYSNIYRYYIYEIQYDDNFAFFNYLDKNKECTIAIPLTELRMVLGGSGSRVSSYQIVFYSGNKKLFYQNSGVGWTSDMIKSIYYKFEKYNKLNSTYVKK